MHFNTTQLQQLTGLNREQLRHWRKVLPPLKGRDGRSNSYMFSEVIALAILEALVNRLGIGVSQLATCADGLFALFAEHGDLDEVPSTIYVTLDLTLSRNLPDTDIYLTIRVKPIVARIKELMAPTSKAQLSLDLM